jgi:hypothetical protein
MASLKPGMHAREPDKTTASEEAALWEACGGLELTGWPEQPIYPDFPLAGRMSWLLAQLAQISPDVPSLRELISARAILGRRDGLVITRRGRVSAGGSCRLLACEDGWVALNLPREEDFELVPAFLAGLEQNRRGTLGAGNNAGITGAWADAGASEDRDDAGALDREAIWQVVAQSLSRTPGAFARQWGSELGLAIGLLPAGFENRQRPSLGDQEPPKPFRVHYYPANLGGQPCPSQLGARAPLVVDLSSLWAGPLCAMLLRRAGMDVVNVESLQRPDPTKHISPSFFNWLREGQTTVVLDFSTNKGRQELSAILQAADLVIESSRPRALQQLGIDANASLASRPGKIWVSITAHGRGKGASRIGLGDDAAVEGGLVAWDSAANPVFCADAIADPASGLVTALAALWIRDELSALPQPQRSALVEVSMAQVARYLATESYFPDDKAPICDVGVT